MLIHPFLQSPAILAHLHPVFISHHRNPSAHQTEPDPRLAAFVVSHFDRVLHSPRLIGLFLSGLRGMHRFNDFVGHALYSVQLAANYTLPLWKISNDNGGSAASPPDLETATLATAKLCKGSCELPVILLEVSFPPYRKFKHGGV